MAFLETRSLTRRFGGLVALNHVDFHINEGEIVSLIGPNGAGKTTFFNLLTGFLRSTSGQVLFKDEVINHVPPHRIAEKGIIRTFQSTKIFSGVSVLEGVMMGCHRRLKSTLWQIIGNTRNAQREEKALIEEVEKILEFVGISSRKDILAQNLPYGEQRVLAIAVALAAGPELLLLDEPVAGLNPEETMRITRLIHTVPGKGVTVLLVEHDMNVVMEISDRVVVLNFGEKIAEGSPQEIQKNEKVIKAYLGDGYLQHAQNQ
jgi:branched-chain amino acid transport system ATP-binding protein